MRIVTVVGARPQFVKAAAVSRAIAAHNHVAPGATIDEQIVHTGQHYDANMSQVFFDELGIPAPAHHLGVGSGSHATQTAAMLEGLEPVLLDSKPDFVLLYGDTNSTLAAAIAASKLNIPIAHVEAGLRSFNRHMPEEINRIAADRLSGLLFCPTRAAVNNLRDEGMEAGVHLTGDVMYDSVLFHADQADRQSRVIETLHLSPRKYYLATVHRAENTDDRDRLSSIFSAFARLDMPVILPLHPRTRNVLGHANIPLHHNIRVIDPAPYLDMLLLEKNARAVLTDSGGMQKEAYWFGVPCVTLRDETEWVELVDAGANTLAGADANRILAAATRDAKFTAAGSLYGDGRASEAIVRILASEG